MTLQNVNPTTVYIFLTQLTYLPTYLHTYLFTYLLHAAESFLGSQPVCSQSKESPHFMEPKGSLLLSQLPAICPYSEPARSSPYSHMTLPEDPSWYYPPIYAWICQVVPFPEISPHNPLDASPLPHTLYMTGQSHSSRIYYSNNIG